MLAIVTHSELEFSVFGFIFNFFTVGVEYHLWFFPALIYSMLAFYFWNLIFKNKKIKFVCAVSVILYIIGLLGCSYYELGIKIPAASLLFDNAYFEIIRRLFLMGFPFFASGYLAGLLNEKFSSKASLKSLITFGVLFLIEIYTLYCLKIYNTVVITLFLYPLTISLIWYLVSNPSYKNEKLGKLCKNTSMIMYYYHPMLLSVLYLFNENKTYNFVIVIAAFIVVGLVNNIINNKNSMKEKVEK